MAACSLDAATFAKQSAGDQAARLAASSGIVRPTKLFIGGISRRTTTKQLRDHFSRYGRVLDCIAMRQPDGRPRGFGYVTLDSPEAAECFLREPQMIDDRYVDLKPAVPDASCSGGKQAPMPMLPPQFCSWPADFSMCPAAGLACNPALSLGMAPLGWGWYDSQLPLPDCPGLLTKPQPAVRQPLGSCLAASQPLCSQQAPLGDVTNTINAGVARHCRQEKLLGFSATKPCELGASGRQQEDLRPAAAPAPAISRPKPPSLTAGSTGPPSSAASADSSPLTTPVAPRDRKLLPSLGSGQHMQGECRRCNFFAKGRCRNGSECVFCHLPHERRKLSRQEKREAQAARLQSEQGSSALPPLLSELSEESADADVDQSSQSPASSATPERLDAAPFRKLLLPPGLPPPGLPAPLEQLAAAVQATRSARSVATQTEAAADLAGLKDAACPRCGEAVKANI